MDNERLRLNFPDTPEERLAFNARSEASVRAYLRSLSWEEKIASIERMREASRIARAAMQDAMCSVTETALDNEGEDEIAM